MNNLRKSNIRKLPKGTFDTLIIGGGINGAVAASALAAKGVKVALIDILRALPVLTLRIWPGEA